MKIQKKGKSYNTDTAIKLCENNSGTLYIKQSGECFLLHKGKIQPLEYEQALNIAEATGYSTIFKNLTEYYSKKRVQINPQITTDTAKILKATTEITVLNQSHIVEIALREFFENQATQLEKFLLLDNIEITGTNKHTSPDKNK